ncbi:MAG: sulfotransferase family 2 domain-containing protein [Boseongicola sp.]|nr:sulfotransferase family 2 domain-containing protein [Boseongicola sp.]MDD9978993.1 sulfotransferase family 2 domain-containing protein [Boseongicola sp.]
MIISPGRKYIFVHIPKTGGTSLALALEARAKADDILIGDTPKARRRRNRLKELSTPGRLWKHSRISDIQGLAQAEPLDDFFVFTLVRNPWDRIFSLFHWLREQSFDHPSVAIAKGRDFPDFVSAPEMREAFENDAVANYVTDNRGQWRCDLCLRLENLSHDINILEERLELKLPPLSHENPSNRPAEYRDAFDKSTTDLVAHWFADDIKRFGYEF